MPQIPPVSCVTSAFLSTPTSSGGHQGLPQMLMDQKVRSGASCPPMRPQKRVESSSQLYQESTSGRNESAFASPPSHTEGAFASAPGCQDGIYSVPLQETVNVYHYQQYQDKALYGDGDGQRGNFLQHSRGQVWYAEPQDMGGQAWYVEAQDSRGQARYGDPQHSGGQARYGDPQHSGGQAQNGNPQYSQIEASQMQSEQARQVESMYVSQSGTSVAHVDTGYTDVEETQGHSSYSETGYAKNEFSDKTVPSDITYNPSQDLGSPQSCYTDQMTDQYEPFTTKIDESEFNQIVKLPVKRKNMLKQGGTAPKVRKVGGGSVREVPTHSMNAMAQEKATQIALAQEMLQVKCTGENYGTLYPTVLEMDRVPSAAPSNPHSFYKIIAMYFPHLRQLDPNLVVNMLREEIAQYMMENHQYLQVI